MEPETTESGRKSRARERVQRRKQREQRTPRTASIPAVRPSVTRPVPLPPAAENVLTQLRDKLPANLNFPKISSRGTRLLLYGTGGLGFMLVVIFLLGRFANEEPLAPPNAIWVGENWTHQRRSEEELTFFAQQLRDHQVGQVYALVSYLNFDNTWSGNISESNRFADVEAAVQTFVTDFNAAYPEATLYAWLVIPTGSGRLAEAAVRQTIVQFASRLTGEFGFDGIFLGVEPIANNDTGFVDLLRELRAALGVETQIAVSVPPDWTPPVDGLTLPPIYAPGAFWEQTYKRQVALLSDVMIITAYNTGFTDAAEYSAWVRYQVETFGAAVSVMDGAHLLIGISTADALRDPATGLTIHDPAAENINSAVLGIRAGLDQLGEDADVLAGVALFSEETTESAEWTLLRLNWLQE